MARRNHYHVYVIELSKDVLYESRFKRCNPGYIIGKPCVYVGMTGLDPDVRFDKHKAGIQSNRYVKEYGLHLLPDLYEAFNPMSYDEACAKEVEVGIDLFNKLALEHILFDNTSSVGSAGNLNITQDEWLLREDMTLPFNIDHELALSTNVSHINSSINADLKNATCTQFNLNCDLTTAPRKQLIDSFGANGWDVSAQDRKRVASGVTLVGGVRHSYEDYLRRSYTEPRLGIEWESTPQTLFTAGWGRHNQMPTGQQIARNFGNTHLQHLRADHSVVGMTHKLDTLWSWKSEVYYKKFSNLIVDDPLLNYVNGASGKAYGMELLIKKDIGEQLSGWFSLSLARSNRHNDITGQSFRFELDQPINATLVTTYQLNEDWKLGTKWSGHSGTPYTPILGTQGTYPDGRPIPLYAAINSGTLPPYHSLDLRLERSLLKDNYKMNLYFEWNNLYGRKNVVGYSYNPSYTSKEPVYPFVLPISFGV